MAKRTRAEEKEMRELFQRYEIDVLPDALDEGLVGVLYDLAKRLAEKDSTIEHLKRQAQTAQENVQAARQEADKAKLKHEGGLEALRALSPGGFSPGFPGFHRY